jgi:hypothetical protein
MLCLKLFKNEVISIKELYAHYHFDHVSISTISEFR